MSRTYQDFNEVLAQIVTVGNQAGAAILKLLTLHKINHSGELGGPGGIVEATRQWVPHHPDIDRRLKRDEINRKAADAHFGATIRRKTFGFLKQIGFVDSLFLPQPQIYDAVLCFGSDLQNIIGMRQLLVAQWHAGVRFNKVFLLNAPYEVAVADLHRMEKLYPRGEGAESLGDKAIFGLKSHITAATMWLWWWHNLPLPTDMRASVGEEVLPIHVADQLDAENNPVPAKTLDWLHGFKLSEAYLEWDTAYLVVSYEPIILRRCLVTRRYLAKQGANVTALGAPEPTRHRSITIYLRELHLLLAELVQEHKAH